jgi:PTH1 family peptidyl-tRNA hydrolase
VARRKRSRKRNRRRRSEGALSPTRLIVGLGNPGRRYAATLHNAGFLAIDRIAESLGARWRAAAAASLATGEIGGRHVVLVKPMTFMNLSGDAVAPLYRKHADGPEDLVVLHDDLDLPVGAVRLKRGGGTGGHNGLRSLKERLGTADFLRIRVGIGRPPAGIDPADYVLTPPAPGRRKAFDAAVGAAGEAFADIVRLGFDKAMARWNAKSRDAAPGKAPPESPGGNILLAPGASSGGSISRKEARSPDDTEEV